MNIKNIVIGIVVIGLIYAGGSYLGKPVITVNVPEPKIIQQEALGGASGTEHYNTERFLMGFGGDTLATSTSGTATTLSEETLLKYTGITMTPNVASFSYTLPATSTLGSLMKNVGDTRTWRITNATTTTATTLTLVKGAGWNLTGVDANTDVIAGAAWGSQVNMAITCERQVDTDIACDLRENIAVD